MDAQCSLSSSGAAGGFPNAARAKPPPAQTVPQNTTELTEARPLGSPFRAVPLWLILGQVCWLFHPRLPVEINPLLAEPAQRFTPALPGAHSAHLGSIQGTKG